MTYCVEDDKNIRDLVVYTLQTGDLDAVGFPDGESFYQEVKNKKPSLILLGFILSGEDGRTILKHLKSSNQRRIFQ